MANLGDFFPRQKNPFVEVAGPLFCLVRNFARNKTLLIAEQPGFFIQFFSHRKIWQLFPQISEITSQT
jgi:hypothetical protein